MGLVFREAENFFRFFFRSARPWANPWSSGSGTSWSLLVLSMLGFESEPLIEPVII